MQHNAGHDESHDYPHEDTRVSSIENNICKLLLQINCNLVYWFTFFTSKEDMFQFSYLKLVLHKVHDSRKSLSKLLELTWWFRRLIRRLAMSVLESRNRMYG